jgi:hypothetical protein
MRYSKEELNEAYNRLPPELREILFSVDITNSIASIGKKYNLHIDQIGGLNSETGLVVLGLTHPTEFVSKVTKRLGVDRVVASQVASDINDQVFLKIRELLKDIQRGTVKREEEEEMEPRPSKDALLAALEHPEGMLKRPVQKPEEIQFVEIKNPYAPQKPEMGKDTPVVAPVPASAYNETEVPAPTPPSGDILTQKMSGQFSMPKTESTVSHSEPATTRKVDPYKEQV